MSHSCLLEVEVHILIGGRGMCLYADVCCGHLPCADGNSFPLLEDYLTTDMQAKKYPPQDNRSTVHVYTGNVEK